MQGLWEVQEMNDSIRFKITNEEKSKFYKYCKAKAINPSLLFRQMVANFIKKTEKEKNNKDG
jgi:hypothetical protein